MAGIEYNRPERDGRTRDQVTSPPSPSPAAEADRGAGSLPGCPSCGRDDEVRAVQAVFLDGHRHVREESGAGVQRRAVTRETVSRLARALAPTAPAPRIQGRSCLGVLLVMVSLGTFWVGALAGHWFGGSMGENRPGYPYEGWDGAETSDPEAGLFFLGVISAIALLAAVVLFVRASRDGRAYRGRMEAGLAAAERLWIRSWYCGRCARVHFEGESAALTLQEFRVRVWTAGGYGDLAETHPAVELIIARQPDGSY
ncbi:hypothetical protein OHA37_34530 [Streptomyces sp. NBC_00335]|uniref:hypothetical protein n=1 Tax=unclassified Streptomyces TaxID=2593676 RepID=UPI00224D0B56|nr:MULTISPECIES: hypothetical protein [unclassified Streptomyces]MCX5408960.1 hypothetical protein [Streptomyces sp. NBC_00086]